MFSFRKKKEPQPFVSAVIPAAGSASRMGGMNKQMLPLGDLPVIAHSILQFCLSPRISEIVVVCREEEIADYYRMAQELNLDKVSSVVAGGSQRQESVFKGISACNKNADYYAIHDGARPLITPEEIENCIGAALCYGAAAVGVPVKDTVKVCGEGGFVASTPDRSKLFAIQTPQIFEASAYRQAMAQAEHYRRDYTDDCQLFEQTGRKVFIAPGSYQNIKITTPEDIALANAILEFRQGGLDQWQY